MAKDFTNGLDAINSMIDDEPAEGTKETKQKKKAITFAFKIDPDIADLVRRYAFLKHMKVKDVMEEIIEKQLGNMELPKREEEKEQHD